jgi:hypothetical protein
LEIARDILLSGGAGLIVIDVSGEVPESGRGGASLAQTLRHLSTVVRRTPYALICLVSAASDGLGAALTRQADLHLRVERQRWVWDAEGVSGYETRLTTLKTRFGPPHRSITLPIPLGERRAGP